VRKHASVEIFGKSAVLKPTSMIAIDGFEFFSTAVVAVTEGVGVGVGVTAEDGFEVGVGLAVGEAVTGMGVAGFDVLPGVGTNGFDITGEGVGVAVFAVEVGAEVAPSAKKRTDPRAMYETRVIFFLIKRTVLLVTDITPHPQN
jgi:hypothetical protein